jgi:hypothetical protein
VATVVCLVVALTGLAGCADSDPFNPGAPVNSDSTAAFAALRQRPDIDQAARQYDRMAGEVRQALSSAIPALADWQDAGGALRSACGNDYPGVGFNGQTRDLPNYVVHKGLSDSDWELALTTIGRVAANYGFTARAQRLHDSPGNHDAVFHNVHDDGQISLGTAKNTVLGVSIGCHLTAAAKQHAR